MVILVTFAAALLIISKLCDVLSTIKYVGANGEINQIAQRLFRCLGFRTTVWLIFTIVVLVAIACVVEVLLCQSWFLGVILSAGMIVVSLFQFSVARFNVTGKHNFFSRCIARLYLSRDFWRKILRR